MVDPSLTAMDPERVAVSVLGPIARDALGFVLPHEHLAIRNDAHFIPHEGLEPAAQVTIDLIGDLRVWPHAVRSNLVLDDERAIADELSWFRSLGGATVVDLTPREMGRDLELLARYSRSSGVQIIGATGYYVAKSHAGRVAGRTVVGLADEMIGDLTGPPPQAGVIGEIGISRDPLEDEWRVLDAALVAQEATGAPIWIHQSTTAPMALIIEHLVKGGRDLSRVVLCHVDYDLRDMTVHRRALEAGLTLELDLFGFPAWARRNFVHAPTDTQRLERILELLSDGYRSQLLISQDLCQKLQLRRYGGFGLGHLLAHVREVFDLLGGTSAAWDAITRENPARLLAWRETQ